MNVGRTRHLTAALTLAVLLHSAVTAWAAGEPGAGQGGAVQPTVLVFGLGERCRYCVQLKQEIAKVTEFTGDAVRFVNYRVDLERDREVIARYRVVLSPTLVFLDASGAEVFRRQGFMDAAQIQGKLAALKLWTRKG